MKSLKQIIEEIQLENEGLIQTNPLESSINMLQTWCSWNGKINYKSFDKTKIIAIVNSITSHEFDVLLKYVNNLGYFPSHVYTEDNNYGRKYKVEDVIKLISEKIPFTLKFEAKYDTADEVLFNNGIFYHATDEIYVKKILKMGLVPKSKNKIASHPDRIYLTHRKEDAYIFAYNPHSKIKNPVIFEIDLNKSNKTIKLYKDPNYSNNKGYYTYDNIPPTCLKLIEKS